MTVIDAIRISDGTTVALKLISMSPDLNTPDSTEIETLQYLSSPTIAFSTWSAIRRGAVVGRQYAKGIAIFMSRMSSHP